MRDGRAIIRVARTVAREKIIESRDTPRHCRNGLQTNGNPVIGEGEFGVGKIRLPAEIAVWPPHVIEHGETTFLLQPRPMFFGKELGYPQHHAETQILGNH
jgi:hypothetical protein